MKEGYIIRDQGKAHYITATVVDWIDIFTRKIYIDCIIDSLKYNINNKNYQLWQYGNYVEEIYSEKFLWSKLDYIHLNPVKAGLVKKAQDYVYSSASNYIYDEGLLDVELADVIITDVSKTIGIKRDFDYE
jgi:hypothetical protein